MFHTSLLNIHTPAPQVWLVVPFILLLLLVATGPIVFPTFWHRSYKLISVIIGLLVACFYVFVRNDLVSVIETFFDYLSFIAIALSLFIAASGIYLSLDVKSTRLNNILFLSAGAFLSNFVGTTGASVLLIRPYLRLNHNHLKPYHIVFFIFFVSNMGGLLTPIGDPPLFLGFIKGIPFFWTLTHLWGIWIVALLAGSVSFIIIEMRNKNLYDKDKKVSYTNKWSIEGKRNFIWIAAIIGTVFLDPNIIDGLPCIELHGKKISYIRELAQIIIAFLCYRTSNPRIRQINEFSFEPVKEIAFLFFGIFLSMIPALQLLSSFGESAQLSKGQIFWYSGLLSATLDNAPTYMNFFTVIVSMFGYDVNNREALSLFMSNPESVSHLAIISVSCVFFGAMTYIGNGPNFMVKAIAEQSGVRMPSFFEYIYKYSLPYLLPVMLFIYFLFLM